MFVKMGIQYDSEDALQTIEQIMQIFRDTAYETSIDLASEKGAFPNFDWSGYSKSKFVKNLPKALQNKIKKLGIRNSTLTTVAPTGSGAIVARVTSGVEPIFATSYKRRVKKIQDMERHLKNTRFIILLFKNYTEQMIVYPIM